MKEVIKVSISGISFAFDQNAFKAMNAYLERLEKGYANNPDGKEIIADIEARIVEIVLSSQSTEQVVSLPLVEKIIEQMGLPDDLESTDTDTQQTHEQFPRRLYRNPDGAKLGGVCNGIATFLNIDTVWVRLSLFAPLFLLVFAATLGFHGICPFLGSLFGMLIVLYFLLCIAVPVARTPRQRLEMRGEKITASSIHESFRNEATSRAASPRSSRSTSVLAEVIYVLGRVVLFGIKAFALLIGFFFAMAAIGIIIAIFCLDTLGAGNVSTEVMQAISMASGIAPIALAAIVSLIILLPIALIVWLILRLIFNTKTNRTAMSIILGIWIIVVIYVSIISIRNLDAVRRSVMENTHIETHSYQSETVGESADSSDIEAFSTTVTTESVVESDSTKRADIKIRINK